MGKKGNYVYRFLKEDIVVYIGRSQNITQRLGKSHHVLTEQFTVEVAKMESKADMYLMECYLINFYKPEHNVTTKTKENDKLSFTLPLPDFQSYQNPYTYKYWLTDEIWHKYFGQVEHHLVHRQCVEGELPTTAITTYARFLYKHLMNQPVTEQSVWHRESVALLEMWNTEQGRSPADINKQPGWQGVSHYFELQRIKAAEEKVVQDSYINLVL